MDDIIEPGYHQHRIIQFKRDLLKEMLEMCTEEQRRCFFMIYPNLTDAQLMPALALAERTIINNQKRT